MNIKSCLFILFCFGASCAAAQTAPYVGGLYDLLWTTYSPLKILPDDEDVPKNFYVLVLLFDINRDGVLEALVTDKDSDGSGTAGEYRLWSLYRFKDGKWEYGPQKEDTANLTDGSTCGFVDGSSRGFFSLTREGQKPVLIASYESKDNDGRAVTFREEAFEVSIDSEGCLRSFPLPELSTNYSVTWAEMDDFIHPEITDRISPNDKLEPLTIKMLLPLEEQRNVYEFRKNGEREVAVTVAAASPPLDKEGSTGFQPVPSQGRALCYSLLALLPITCAVLYFVWRKGKAAP